MRFCARLHLEKPIHIHKQFSMVKAINWNGKWRIEYALLGLCPQIFRANENEMRQKSTNRKNITTKWQTLHIAESDIIEFNVVKWFCSGEYLIHTQKKTRRAKKKSRYVVPYVHSEWIRNREMLESKLWWQRTIRCMCASECVQHSKLAFSLKATKSHNTNFIWYSLYEIKWK